MVLCLRPRNQTSVKPVEDGIVTLPKKKAPQVNSFVAFFFVFNVRGIVHSEFVPPGHTINQTFYLEVLKKLHNCVGQKDPICCSRGTGVSIATTYQLTQPS